MKRRKFSIKRIVSGKKLWPEHPATPHPDEWDDVDVDVERGRLEYDVLDEHHSDELKGRRL